MKVRVFPTFSFLYSFLERWLHKMSTLGFVLDRRTGWLWYFQETIPSDTYYFLWLRRFKGKDCLDLATSVHIDLGKGDLIMSDTGHGGLCITELDEKKLPANQYLSHYKKKRNWICMKIAGQNFIGVTVLWLFCIFGNVLEVLFFLIVAIFGVNFCLHIIHYLMGK